MISSTYFSNVIDQYRNENNYNHSREYSWNHCYNYFCEVRKDSLDDETVDRLCLNLAFFLASWGMYRGSAFLFKLDYKVHEPVVREIMKSDYADLQGIKCSKYYEECFNTLFKLVGFIRNAYSSYVVNGKTPNVTDTLVTKILLGTLCCTPAYDACFVKALRKYQINSAFNKDSFQQLVSLCNNNNLLESVDSQIDLPDMKLIDMGFWEIGFRKA